MKKVIAISVSDAHNSNWKQFNPDGERLRVSNAAWKKIIDKSIKYKCPILFSGDLIDHPKHLDNIVIDHLSETLNYLTNNDKRIIGINGNHDFYTKSSFNTPANGYLTHLKKMGCPIECIDYHWYQPNPKLKIHGIPYINSNSDFDRALENAKLNISPKLTNILLIHSDLPGAKEPDGREVGSCENISKYSIFKEFDLVLSGHIHKFQKLAKNVYMVGALMQQRRGDAGTDMGYCLIHEDLSVTHINSKLPEFKFYNFGEEKPDTPDFWIENPPPIQIVDEEKHGLNFDVKSDRKKLAKNYLKAKGIKSKQKLTLLTKYLND